MPFNPPNPDPKPEKPLAHSLVQAERLIQIALVLPIAVLIGWFFGSCSTAGSTRPGSPSSALFSA